MEESDLTDNMIERQRKASPRAPHFQKRGVPLGWIPCVRRVSGAARR